VDEASLGASRQLDTAPTPAPAPNPAPNADTPVLVLGGVGSGRPPEAADNGAIATRLATLRDLRARDLLTEAEYQERREAILRRAFGLGPGSGAGTGSAPAD
jgi:hypothetical protein